MNFCPFFFFVFGKKKNSIFDYIFLNLRIKKRINRHKIFCHFFILQNFPYFWVRPNFMQQYLKSELSTLFSILLASFSTYWLNFFFCRKRNDFSRNLTFGIAFWSILVFFLYLSSLFWRICKKKKKKKKIHTEKII